MEQRELISTGVEDIASSLGLSQPEPQDEPAQDEPAATESSDAAPAAAEPAAEPAPEIVASKPAPGSWAKEMHEMWGKLDPKVQEYIEKRENDWHKGIDQYREHHTFGRTMNDVIAPYRQMIAASGIDDAKAVAALFNAHAQLTQGSIESRLAAYQRLGRDLGFAQAQPGLPQQDPAIAAALEKAERVEQMLNSMRQKEESSLRDQTTKEVDAFAKDKPYFDEVAGEMVAFISAGASLEDAYDKAVWANPVTRAKETARLQSEAEAKLKDKAKESVGKARSATAANVRGRDTGRTPTEPKGKFLDDRSMLEDLRSIQERSH